jgi:hypothetical protein
MQLPLGGRAEVDPRKVRDYLLSDAHPIGRSKAKFFRGVGFNEVTADLLVAALRSMASTQEVTETLATAHGVKYVLIGETETPSGRRIRLRTIWIVDRGRERPRFVTAYPA